MKSDWRLDGAESRSKEIGAGLCSQSRWEMKAGDEGGLDSHCSSGDRDKQRNLQGI